MDAVEETGREAHAMGGGALRGVKQCKTFSKDRSSTNMPSSMPILQVKFSVCGPDILAHIVG